MTKGKLISIIVPVFNEEDNINVLYERVRQVVKDYEYEIIFVNDGSKDKTEMLVNRICEQDKNVKLINFARNFGHQIAITAGMDYCKGDAVIVIDADLQDPPEMIPKLIEKYNEGYHVVYAVRKKRKGETLFKKATAKIFYRLLKSITDIDIPVDTGDFRLISREVCDVLKSMKEKNRFVRGLVSWVGFNQIGIEYVRDERYAGETKYPLKKMIKFSLDGISSFSTKPLKLSISLGFIMTIIAFIYAIYAIINKLFFNGVQSGWTSIIVLIILIGGIQMIMLGIVGEYIARIFDESKQRPLYVVRSVVNNED
jgi:glycosyltransferase involved in cell wall biosynthesis